MNRYASLNPWQVLDEMRAQLERGYGNETANIGSASFPIDVLEENDHLLVKVNLPGVAPDSVNLSLENNTLTLTANLASDAGKGQRYLWRERPTGTVRRAITLPVRLNPEGTQANLENGVLVVRVNKAVEATARQIPIQVSNHAQAITQGQSYQDQSYQDQSYQGESHQEQSHQG